jgi:hypothetical protein
MVGIWWEHSGREWVTAEGRLRPKGWWGTGTAARRGGRGAADRTSFLAALSCFALVVGAELRGRKGDGVTHTIYRNDHPEKWPNLLRVQRNCLILKYIASVQFGVCGGIPCTLLGHKRYTPIGKMLILVLYSSKVLALKSTVQEGEGGQGTNPRQADVSH